MFDRELVSETLSQILAAATKAQQRSEMIDPADPGFEVIVDSICMQLIVVGEGLKNLDKITDAKLLDKYPQVNWKAAKGLRDIICHNYSGVDIESVIFVCNEKIPELIKVIKLIITEQKC